MSTPESGRSEEPLGEETARPIMRQDLRQLRVEAANLLDPVLARREAKLQELAAHREKGELSPFDLDLNFVAELWSAGGRLIRKDMMHQTGLQALVLTSEDLEAIGGLEFEHVTEGMQVINPGDIAPNDVLILYPWEVADIEVLHIDGPAAANEALQAETMEMLQAIFADIGSHQDVRIDPNLEASLTTFWEHPAQFVGEARKRDVPEELIRRYAYVILQAKILTSDYGFVARFLKNMGFGTLEQQEYFEAIAKGE